MNKPFYLILILITFMHCAYGQDNKRLENINLNFNKMELQGIDIEKPLLFGYFFYDRDKSKLENLKNELLKDNYKLVRLELTENNNYILHVEKIEMLTSNTLLEKEIQLEKLTKKYKVEIYDGWDVGNKDPTMPLFSKTDFEKTLDTIPNDELYILANNLYKSDSSNKAILVFTKCIEKNINLDTSNYKLGVIYFGLEQPEKGIEKFEEALRLNPNYFNACFNLGVIYYDYQLYQKSVDNYEKAAKINPNDDKVFYGIAASQFVLEQYKNAEINCKIALKLNSSNTEAQSLLEKLKKKN